MRIESVGAVGDRQDRTGTPPVAVALGDQERRIAGGSTGRAGEVSDGGQRWNRAASRPPMMMRRRQAAVERNVWGDA
nr:unnamed protein product [Digitaria exilis]